MTKLFGYIKLLAFSLILFIFFAYIGPFFVSRSTLWQDFANIQVEIGVDSGALYYTDVPVTKAAELATREGVRKGMLERQEKNEIKDK